MQLRPVTPRDMRPTVEALVSAFATDPLISFLFAESADRNGSAGRFFQILLEVRVALGMPAFCAEVEGVLAGAAMGYDATRPAWPDLQTTRWADLLAATPGLERRLHEYESLADRFAPTRPHYYLGVIGVRAGMQGTGVGRALLTTFGRLSAADTASAGVYLETASEDSLRFYLRNGFELRGEGTLGGTTRLWCVFQETGPAGSNSA